MLVSVVVPAKNEKDNIAPLVAEIVNAVAPLVDFEIIYVDDGSDDGTLEELYRVAEDEKNHLRIIQHRYSVGQSTAIYSAVRQAKGELIVSLDADGQNDPADIPKLLEKALSLPAGSHFCIAGYRKGRKDTRWKRFQSRVANKVRASLLKDETPDTGCGLKIIPRHTYLRLPYFNHMHRFLPSLVKRLGGSIVTVVVNHRDRQFGQSKYNMLGRLGAGLVDLLGVMWLQRRSKLAEIVNHEL